MSSASTSSALSTSYAHLPYIRTNRQRQAYSQLPVKYNPDVPLPDALACFDPVPDACHYYTDQVRLQFADQKRLPTFDLEKNEYVQWDCKWAGLDKMTVALESDQVDPPLCHHILNSQHTTDFCRMYVRKRNAKDPTLDVTGYLTPRTHCCIWHPIHPCDERLITARVVDDYSDGEALDTDCEDEHHPSPVTSTAKIDIPEHLVWADSSATFHTDSMVYTQNDLYHTCTEFGREPDNWTSHGALFNIGKLCRVSSNDGKGHSLFTEEAARDRRLTDIEVVKSILELAKDGEFLHNPRAHPAFDVSGGEGHLPECFENFVGPNSEVIAFNRTGHLRGTPIGMAILLFNGTEGLNIKQFAELRKRMHKCTSCYAYFSFDGYQHHLGYSSSCQNTPDFETVPSLDGVLTRIPPLSVEKPPAGVMKVSRPAAVNPVGLAWLTWNSRVGVTHDTWVHMITAWRRCDTCAKVRSFQGHLSHLEEEGECGDEGDDGMDIVGRAVLRLSQGHE
ncbi:hypothetical protein C8J55DRAFT_561602 [Lentinula edodes]|uniref:Uncharacterized protein n=1 Tax=Lentinula lateritia TaxID=40482 RepID=A0A9W9A8G7_9AGAR|nr:hypothetical protein C8J55DRAFT_561602 [Lentinula edodes]